MIPKYKSHVGPIPQVVGELKPPWLKMKNKKIVHWLENKLWTNKTLNTDSRTAYPTKEAGRERMYWSGS